MLKKYAVSLLLILVFLISNSSLILANNFLVAPGVLHLNTKDNRPVDSFIVRNTSNEKIRLRLSPTYYPIGSKSMKMGTPIREDIVDDISKFLIVSPRVVSLKPGQRRTVRVAFRKTKPYEPGDYRAHILIRTVAPVKQKTKPKNEAKGVSLNLKIKLQTAIAVYVHSGKSNASLEFQVNKIKSDIEIISINNTKFKYDGWFQIIQGKNKSNVQRFMVFRESMRSFFVKDQESDSLTIKWGDQKDNLKHKVKFNLK